MICDDSTTGELHSKLVSRTMLINYQALSAQPERQRVQQEEEDPQRLRLIPLAHRSSEYSKRFFGTGWRNAQLIATLSSGNVLLPEDWNHKDNGVTIRAKIMGEPVYVSATGSQTIRL